jgi:RNA polymerase sigma-70 factor (ECF subfamily)
VTEPPAGEPSFEIIYRRFAPGVVGYLRANGVDDPEAVMQEVFISVLAKIGKISGGEDGARTLLFSIAHARAVDHHRHRVRVAPTVEYDPKLDQRSTSSAEDIALAHVVDESTIAILTSLKDDHREVLLLRVVADLPLEQVAKVMGKSIGSVKQLQRRALLALVEHPDIAGGAFR